MEYWKLSRWPHWFSGVFALVGIFFARKLFDTHYLTISFWFFLPFLLSGIASELLITALSLSTKSTLLSESERKLALVYDWKVLACFAFVLFTIAAVLANLYTKGLHSSWFILLQAALALVFGILLRRLWLIDCLTYPLFYLIPTVAGTLDTMLPLYATQIVLIYSFGLVIYSLRLSTMVEDSFSNSGSQTFHQIGGHYERDYMPYLAGLAALSFVVATQSYLTEQAARLGRTSLLVLPILLFVVATVILRYRQHLKTTGAAAQFKGVVLNLPVLISLALSLTLLAIAVSWNI